MNFELVFLNLNNRFKIPTDYLPFWQFHNVFKKRTHLIKKQKITPFLTVPNVFKNRTHLIFEVVHTLYTTLAHNNEPAHAILHAERVFYATDKIVRFQY